MFLYPLLPFLRSLVPIVLHPLFSTPFFCFYFNCGLQSPSPTIPGLNLSLPGWPACWQRCPCSTLHGGSHLFLAVLHLQRGSHGCKSEHPEVDTSCVSRCWPAELHPRSDLALDRSLCCAVVAGPVGDEHCALWGTTTVVVDPCCLHPFPVPFCASVCTRCPACLLCSPAEVLHPCEYSSIIQLFVDRLSSVITN